MGKINHISAQQTTPRGIIRDSKGVSITTIGLPMSDYFFQANSFKMKRFGSNLIMQFGAQSAFPEDDDTEYRLAVEIVFPLETANKYLYDINWNQQSIGHKDSFGYIVEQSVKDELANYVPPKEYKTPKGSNFRSFPANVALMSLSIGQGAIEFFEAPPGLIVEAIHQKSGWRPNSDVRAILTVVLPPVELYRFLDSAREILKDIPVKYKDAKED